MCFVPCGACELQSEETRFMAVHHVSSPVGRVSCNSFDVITINTSIVVSSPVGRVSCNSRLNNLYASVHLSSSPVGRVSCNTRISLVCAG